MAKESEEQVRQRAQIERERRRQDELRERELAKKQQKQKIEQEKIEQIEQEQDNHVVPEKISTGRENSISSAIDAFNKPQDEEFKGKVKSPVRSLPIQLPKENGDVVKSMPPDVVPNESKLKFQEVSNKYEKYRSSYFENLI